MASSCEEKECKKDHYCDPGFLTCHHCSEICDSKNGPKNKPLCRSHCSDFDVEAFQKKVNSLQSSTTSNTTSIPTNSITEASTSSMNGLVIASIILMAAIVLVLILCCIGFACFRKFGKKKEKSRSFLDFLKYLLCCGLCNKKKDTGNIDKSEKGLLRNNEDPENPSENDQDNSRCLNNSVDDNQEPPQATRINIEVNRQYLNSVERDSGVGYSERSSGNSEEVNPGNRTADAVGSSSATLGVPMGGSPKQEPQGSRKKTPKDSPTTNPSTDPQFEIDSKLTSILPSQHMEDSMAQLACGGNDDINAPLLGDLNPVTAESILEGAVGGEPNQPRSNNVLPEAAAPMTNMFDNDSGCGSVLVNSVRPSQEFEQMNRQLYQERGVDIDRIGQQDPAAVPQQDQQPMGQPLEELFPGALHPSKQKNRGLYDELKKIDWVMGYHSAGESIEVYVNLGSLDPTTIEEKLADRTGAPVTKFHVKQNEDTEFMYYSGRKRSIGVSSPIKTVPFFQKGLQYPHYSVTNWRKAGPVLNLSCVVGGFVSVEGDEGTYCITVSHPLRKGALCYVEFDSDYVLLGECVSIVNTVGFKKALCDNDESLNPSHLDDCDVCFDLAVIKICDEDFDVKNVFCGPEEEPQEFELFDWKTASKNDLKRIEKSEIQMKSNSGEIRTGRIENLFCDYNNKVKKLQMHSQITVRGDDDSAGFLHPGDCGALLTSLPDPTTRRVEVYGMFYGYFVKRSGDKHAVAFPLSVALEQASKRDFQGRKISLLKTPVHGYTKAQRAECLLKVKEWKSKQSEPHSLDSGIEMSDSSNQF